MKKRFFVISILILLIVASWKSVLYAEDAKEMGMMEGMKGGEWKGMMGGKMMGMHMMKMMMEKSVTPTSDGGVVVVAGNKITKYDRNLNLVNEAEIKMDMEAMGKNMKEMMAQCPMMKGKEKAGETPAEESAPESDHESHH